MFDMIIQITASILSVSAIAISIIVYAKGRAYSSYLDIEKQYFELLRISIDCPSLRNPAYTTTYSTHEDTELLSIKYHSYALMCWNLMETLYDIQKDGLGKFQLSETWRPIMLEENRLHYSWLRNNKHLFKKEFFEYITNTFNGIDASLGSIDDLRYIYTHFNHLFPQEELKSLKHLEMLLLKKHYQLILAKHHISEEIIGFALVYLPEQTDFLWLDYIAIGEKYQSMGYGSLFLNKLFHQYATTHRGVFIEVDIPDPASDEHAIQLRRIAFYKRLGAIQLPFDYLFPSKSFCLPMHLFFKPLDSSLHLLSQQQIYGTIDAVYSHIHSDVLDKEKHLSKMKKTIKDVVLE